MLPRHLPISFLLLCAAVAGAQTATARVPPAPVKMGLWETTVTSQISGLQLPPDVVAKLKAMGRKVPGGSHTMVSQGCLTPEEWQKDMADMNKPADHDCVISNRHVDSHKISMDIACKSERGDTSNGHWEMQVVDDEHGHGSAHMTSNTTGPNGQNVTMDITFDSRYLSSNCGDVKPGDSKIIRHDD